MFARLLHRQPLPAVPLGIADVLIPCGIEVVHVLELIAVENNIVVGDVLVFALATQTVFLKHRPAKKTWCRLSEQM